jgi:hypothetical protein
MSRVRTTTLAAAGVITLLAPLLSGPAQAAPPVPGPEVAFALAAPGNSQRDAAVAWNGSVYLVVWEEGFASGAPTAIFGARVSASGAVLGSPFRISAADEFDPRSDPAVASNGAGFMVVYQVDPEGTYSDLRAAIVSGTGAVSRPEWAFRNIDNDQLDPAIAWNGSRYLVTWEDGPDPSDPDIFAARALADGRSYDGCSFEQCPPELVDNPGIPIYATYGNVADSLQTQPAVAARNGTFHIAWRDTENAPASNIRGARLQNGVVIDTPPYVVSNAVRVQQQPALAANGDQLLSVWTDRRSGTSQDLYADLGGADFAVSTRPGSQADASVTRRGPGFLVGWTDNRSGGQDIYAARVTAGGLARDNGGVVIAASGAQETEPALAAGAHNRQLIAYTRTTTNSRVVFRLLD